ncbi:serine/threonine protein kinase, partial [Myxococcota bacterium]|nr:serine/threonine protein kinase [Myxococcota bacterium]
MSFDCRECGFSQGRPGRCPRDGHLLVDAVATVEAPSDRLLGTMVAGKYALVGLLGRGAFGHVYRAWHEVLDREVAVKIIRRSKAHGATFRERFFVEARAVARLRGPNIVTLHDFGEDTDGRLYMVLELVVGTNLRQAVPNGSRLPPERAARLMLPVLRALAHAHAQGVVHRDLKPSNLMLTTDDEAQETIKVLDFGVAKLLDADAETGDGESGPGVRVTHHGQVVGTPRYVSPEQAVGADVGPTSDLYTVGIILFELMAGRAPFQGPTPTETARLRVMEPAPPLPAETGASPALAEVVDRALARLPEGRFASAADFAAALRACPELTTGPVEHPAAPIRGALTAVVELHGDATSDVGLSAASGDASLPGVPGMGSPPERRRGLVFFLLFATVAIAAVAAVFGLTSSASEREMSPPEASPSSAPPAAPRHDHSASATPP